MEVEYIALSEVVKEVMYMRRLLTHIDGRIYADDPTCINCDNQSAVKFSKDSIYNQRSKHVDIRFHFSRKAQEDGEVTGNLSGCAIHPDRFPTKIRQIY